MTMDDNYRTKKPELWICIDKWEHGQITGTIHNLTGETTLNFGDLDDMIFKMQEMVELFYFPLYDINEFHSIKLKKGKLETMLLKVYYFQDHSWQGTISWISAKKRQSFKNIEDLKRQIITTMS